jgi:hypothetical protein
MPLGDDVSALTDWVELRISAVDTAGLPLSKLDRLLKAEGSELADEELASSDADEQLEVALGDADAAAAEVDVRVELIMREVADRAALGARVYPFAVGGERVQRREVCGSDVYLLLLVLGSAHLPYRKERRANEVEEAFDFIAMAALKRFLGRGGATGLRFARTAQQDDAEPDAADPDPRRRPTGFADAIAWLRDWLDAGRGVRDPASEPDRKTHWEDDGEPDPPPLGRPPLTSYNDAGVDVVVWWRFSDKRSGFPVLLAQCTVQLAWEHKVHDVSIELWQKWIDFDTVPPQKALVIPFADRRDHPQWQDRTSKAGVILDRVRLIELLDELECDELAALVDDRARDWVQAELLAA